MSERWLPVPHRIEEFAGGCLPACCQMALEFLGVFRAQKQIAAQIGYVEGAGTPATRVSRISTWGVSVRHLQNAALNDREQSLQVESVVIAFLRTSELPYWEEDTPHAVVVVGVDRPTEVVYVNDPAFGSAPIAVPLADFMLAWDEFGNQCAVISPKSRRTAGVEPSGGSG